MYAPVGPDMGRRRAPERGHYSNAGWLSFGLTRSTIQDSPTSRIVGEQCPKRSPSVLRNRPSDILGSVLLF